MKPGNENKEGGEPNVHINCSVRKSTHEWIRKTAAKEGKAIALFVEDIIEKERSSYEWTSYE